MEFREFRPYGWPPLTYDIPPTTGTYSRQGVYKSKSNIRTDGWALAISLFADVGVKRPRRYVHSRLLNVSEAGCGKKAVDGWSLEQLGDLPIPGGRAGGRHDYYGGAEPLQEFFDDRTEVPYWYGCY